MSDSETRFWELADALVAAHCLALDQPAGSRHPCFPGVIYPFDDGSLGRPALSMAMASTAGAATWSCAA